MRRAELDKVHEIETGRSTERPVSFPDILLYRGRAGDGADCLATFDRRTIVLSRPVAGLACRIRLSLRQYQAIAVVAKEDGNVVRLMHRDPGLSVDLTRMESFEAAEAYRDRLSDFLDLPPLMMAGNGAAAEKVAERAAPKGRRTRPVRGRRPRFLARRQAGAPVSVRRITGREIIARH
jgi:hypothetical protein